MKAARAFILPPHSYGLAATVERLCIPHTFKAHFIGKSTYARCGIIVNLTPGEPGWRGRLTVEISNPTPCPVMIYANQGICQMELYHLSATPERLYDDKKYQDQVDITLPRSSE
jgi:dCTP deaminase